MTDLRSSLSHYFSVFSDLRSELTLALQGWDTPTVVVFGPQNAGKSTLLERLAMLPLFPRGEGLCTRVPIRIRLRQGEARKPILKIVRITKKGEDILDESMIDGEVLGQISKLMHALVSAIDQAERGIRADRLIEVELWDQHYPNIDLLDLPGMVVAPGVGDVATLPEQTYQLVLDMIDRVQGRALFLAVREAGYDIQQSLTTKILREKPEIKAVSMGVLTKCDKYSDEHILDQLQASEEWALGYGYVATMHRPAKDGSHVLTDLAEAERTWFNKNEDRIAMKQAGQAGCDELVSKLSEAYHSYLESTWAPRTMKLLSLEVYKRQRDIKDLGVPELGADINSALIQPIQDLVQQILYTAFGQVSTQLEKQLRAVSFWTADLLGELAPKRLVKTEQLGIFDKSTFLLHALRPDTGIIPRIVQHAHTLLTSATRQLQEEFERLLKEDQSPTKVGRFSVLCQTLIETLSLPQLNLTLLQMTQETVESWLRHNVTYQCKDVAIHTPNQLNHQLITTSLLELSRSLPTFDLATLHRSIPDLFCDDHDEARHQLRDRIEQIQHVQKRLSQGFELDIPDEVQSRVKFAFELIENTKGDLAWTLSWVATDFDEWHRSRSSMTKDLTELVDTNQTCLAISFQTPVELSSYTLQFYHARKRGEKARSWNLSGENIDGQQVEVDEGTGRKRSENIDLNPGNSILLKHLALRVKSDTPRKVTFTLSVSGIDEAGIIEQLKQAAGPRDQESVIKQRLEVITSPSLLPRHRYLRTGSDTIGILRSLCSQSGRANFELARQNLSIKSSPWKTCSHTHQLYGLVLSRSAFQSWSSPGKTPYVTIKLNKDRGYFRLCGYFLRSGRGDNNGILINWRLMGITPSGQEILFDERKSNKSLVAQGYGKAYFQLSTLSQPLVGVKLVYVGPNFSQSFSNHRLGNILSISGIELYGDYYEPS